MLELDTSGLKCPLPVLKARKAIGGLEPGETIRVIATDPSTVADFQEFCANTGHQLVDSSEEGGIFVYKIKKIG